MTPDTDRPEGGRATQQQAPPSTAGMTSKKGETLPQGTLAFSGRKQGLPSEFGRYRVQRLLGGGGMGAVYLVVNTELEREEALKVPHFDAADDPQVRERFLREAKAAAGLDHPNLCPVYDVGVRDGIYYLTMRYLKGKLLSEYSGSAQPPREAVEIVVKLAQALATAHAKGVIHRDLKPNNIMMCADVGPVVMDFGLAKQTDRQDQALTQMGTTLGTPAYMPPEQVKGELDQMGPASDVYSLGVILFQLLTGRLPFEGRTAEVYGNILHVAAPAPSSLRPGLPAALDAICAKAMAKAPESRYASMKEFAAALIDYPNASAAVGKSGKSRSRRLMPVLALGVLLMLGVGIVGAYFWMTSASRPAPNTLLASTQPSPAPAANPVEPAVKPTLTPETLPVEAAVKQTSAPKTLPVETAVNPSPMTVEPAPSRFQTPFNRPNNPIGPSFKHLPEPEVEPVEPIVPAAAPLRVPATHPVEALPDGVIANSIGMKLKLIKAGKFLMGAPVSKKNGSGDEQPQHEAAIAQPFYLGVYPVTKAQFAAFVSDADYMTEAEKADDKSTWRDPGFEQTDDDPVVCVSWKDAEKFCAWLSEREKRTYHLPSEAQWEYACRAGTTTAYFFGDDPKMLDDFAWYGDNSESHTHPVGDRKPNPWGLYDMHGNVWQWCVDSYNAGHYQKTSKGLQFILETNKGVWRGGSWSGSTRDCRAASRLSYSPGNRKSNYGLRVCIRLN
jgi:formylglycine-generating enzyme required for sulfatase activity